MVVIKSDLSITDPNLNVGIPVKYSLTMKIRFWVFVS